MIFDRVMGMFSIDMGIDLGTCNTLVCVKGEGIVLNEPSVVAVKKGTNRVLQNAIGALLDSDDARLIQDDAFSLHAHECVARAEVDPHVDAEHAQKAVENHAAKVTASARRCKLPSPHKPAVHTASPTMCFCRK